MGLDNITDKFKELGPAIEATGNDVNEFITALQAYLQVSHVDEESAGLAESAELLPGVDEKTAYPCGHHPKYEDYLQDIIVHLNDDDHWSREQIADWLESLDIDLEFK